MPDTTIEQLEALAAKRKAMGDLLLGVIPPDMPHKTLLEALLNVYMDVAESHPCCTLNASAALLNAAGRLRDKAFDKPAGAPVH